MAYLMGRLRKGDPAWRSSQDATFCDAVERAVCRRLGPGACAWIHTGGGIMCFNGRDRRGRDILIGDAGGGWGWCSGWDDGEQENGEDEIAPEFADCRTLAAAIVKVLSRTE